MTQLDEEFQRLHAAALACRGWSWPNRRRDPDTGTHYFGRRNEDGDFSEIGTVDASTYTGEYVDDLRVLKFLRLAQPSTVAALIEQIKQLRAELAETTAARNSVLEEAAIEAERQDRTGREWVRDSVWDNIIKRVPAAIRALKEKK
ncbi:hypothetical protein FHW58_003439 [Duganella sp. 1224]|uniref:hypothetical protein n=1 Tax=Duganella sp. 1224 TaxID=2587052 RepID=UPI0015C99BB7|nr:hypothetical protein [Duganella sp. 1224]NYE62224.1 hypothetical protein [Duganella sp. 1224]